jgi:hypothetical protein
MKQIKEMKLKQQIFNLSVVTAVAPYYGNITGSVAHNRALWDVCYDFSTWLPARSILAFDIFRFLVIVP